MPDSDHINRSDSAILEGRLVHIEEQGRLTLWGMLGGALLMAGSLWNLAERIHIQNGRVNRLETSELERKVVDKLLHVPERVKAVEDTTEPLKLMLGLRPSIVGGIALLLGMTPLWYNFLHTILKLF